MEPKKTVGRGSNWPCDLAVTPTPTPNNRDEATSRGRERKWTLSTASPALGQASYFVSCVCPNNVGRWVCYENSTSQTKVEVQSSEATCPSSFIVQEQERIDLEFDPCRPDRQPNNLPRTSCAAEYRRSSHPMRFPQGGCRLSTSHVLSHLISLTTCATPTSISPLWKLRHEN